MSVRDTSMKSYEKLKENLNPTLRMIYDAMVGYYQHKGKWPTDRQLMGWLNKQPSLHTWQINAITGRRNDLVALGMVIPGEKVTDIITGRTVYTWEILGPPQSEDPVTDKDGQAILF